MSGAPSLRFGCAPIFLFFRLRQVGWGLCLCAHWLHFVPQSNALKTELRPSGVVPSLLVLTRSAQGAYGALASLLRRSALSTPIAPQAPAVG